jgi:hypothetical protein
MLADSGIDDGVQRANRHYAIRCIRLSPGSEWRTPAIEWGGQCIADPHVVLAPFERAQADVTRCQTCTPTIVHGQRFLVSVGPQCFAIS